MWHVNRLFNIGLSSYVRLTAAPNVNQEDVYVSILSFIQFNEIIRVARHHQYVWSMCRETWDVCSSFLHVPLGHTGWGSSVSEHVCPGSASSSWGGDTWGPVGRDGDLPSSGAWRQVNPLRPHFPVPLLAATSPFISSFLHWATLPQLPPS